jgi:hypothetical protein
MTETVHSDYEVSSERPTCHWEIPYPRLFDQTPTPTNPAQVSALAGTLIEVNGTIKTISPGPTAATSFAVIDFTPSMVYMHDVRTVLTYAGGALGAENAWGALNIGDPVFYDNSSTMVAAGIYLSTAPANNTPATGLRNNVQFGWIVPAPLAGAWDTDAATYPKLATVGGLGAVGLTHRCAVMQVGAGG